MRKSIAILVAALFIPLVSSADIVVTMQTDGKDDGHMYVSGKNLRMKGGGQNEEMIFLGDSQTMLAIDSGKQQYTEITKKDIKLLSSKMDDAMGKLDAQMANMPPEQQAMMKRMMGGMMKKMMPQKKAPAKVTKTNDKATISGYPCVKYVVTRDGEKTREYWVADASSLKGGEELRVALDSMSGFFQEFIESVSKGPMANMIENPISEFSAVTVRGVPIKTVMFKNGRKDRETLIKSVKTEDIQMSMFRAPDGFSRRSIADGLK